MEGRSLVPIFSKSSVPWRDSFVIEYFSDTVPPHFEDGISGSAYGAVEVHSLHGAAEHGRVYDLAADPYELKNLIANSAHRADRNSLSEQLDQLLRPPER